jgi:hypothetical protein
MLEMLNMLLLLLLLLLIVVALIVLLAVTCPFRWTLNRSAVDGSIGRIL